MENSYATATFKEANEIELELGLSLGGSFRKTDILKPVKNDKENNQTTQGERTDCYAKQSGFRVHLGLDCAREAEIGDACVDSLSRREIHAIGRQEAKKKREAKQQQKKVSCSARNGESPNGDVFNGFDSVGDREFKRMKMEGHGSANGISKGVNLYLSVEQNANQNFGSGPNLVSSVQPPCQDPAPHFSPFNNTVPILRGGIIGKGRNLVQPAPSRSLRPYRAGHNVINGFGSEQNVGNTEGKENGKTVTNGSPVCSSSGVSDPNSSSLQGGSSCDSGTYSSHTRSEQPLVNDKRSVAYNTSPNSEHKSFGPIQTEPAQRNDKSNPNPNTNVSETQQSANAKKENGKPPKPQQTQNQVFAQMPCVTTTGNGPNGKTVNGFLYRYSKSEISIICVCHGSSLSPAEFVRHAGGTEVSHPLRHITVIPSAF